MDIRRLNIKLNKRCILRTACLQIAVLIIFILLCLLKIPKHINFTITLQKYDTKTNEYFDEYTDMTIDMIYFPRIVSINDEINYKGTIEIDGEKYGTYINKNLQWCKGYLYASSFTDNLSEFVYTDSCKHINIHFSYEFDDISIIIYKAKSDCEEYWRTSFTALEPATLRFLCELLHINESDIGSLLP